MPTYIALLNYTDQGIKTFKDTLDRADAAREVAEKFGGRFKDIYWTLGPYDIVGILEAPDDETVEAQLLALGSQGNIRTTTLRAFTAEEMRPIIEKATG